MNGDFDDDNEDLSLLDRGDTLEPTATTGSAPASDAPPAEKSEGDESAGADGEATETETTGNEQPRDAQGRFVSKDQPAEEGEENLPIRLNKAKAQRDAERARADALEAELRALRAQQQPKQEAAPDPVAALNAEIDSLYEKIEDARLDGDAKTAAQLQRQLDSKNRELVKLEAVQETRQLTLAEQHAAQYDAMLDVLEAQIDVLNPASENYDHRVVAELEFQVQAYEKAGLSAPQALSRACSLLFRIDPAGGKPSAMAAVPEKPKPEPKKPDIEKALDTARRQPPDMTTKGVDAGVQSIDVTRLTDEEFDALPEAVKRRLRGDEL